MSKRYMKNDPLVMSALLFCQFLWIDGCDLGTEEYGDGDERCNGSTIEYCSMSDTVCTWEELTQCSTSQTCEESTSNDSIIAVCVNADGSGAVCDSDVDNERCHNNAIQYCDSLSGVWAQYEQCTTSQTCEESTSNGSIIAVCVNVDGSGAICDPEVDNEKCVDNAIQYCDSLSEVWKPYDQCTTDQTCTENTVVDDYGKGSVEALCVNQDQTGAHCDPDVNNERCIDNSIQYCDSLSEVWKPYDQCTTDQTCTETSIVDDYGESVTA
jgi:hypothetical protein